MSLGFKKKLQLARSFPGGDVAVSKTLGVYSLKAPARNSNVAQIVDALKKT